MTGVAASLDAFLTAPGWIRKSGHEIDPLFVRFQDRQRRTVFLDGPKDLWDALLYARQRWNTDFLAGGCYFDLMNPGQVRPFSST